MPKVLSRQPAWLDHGRPAYNLFQLPGKAKARQQPEASSDGPCRKIAHRGTEVFVVVDNELRWSDLATLKDGSGNEDMDARQRKDSARAYKVLKTPVARPILQLSISPSGDFIALLTSHTCHVCVLPSREHLNFHDEQPIAARAFQVGPTAHVLEQAPLARALWHPLSPTGNGLVTITQDACVRLWELDTRDRSSFNEPALAIDLKKLRNAASVHDDLGASRYGENKGFSPDDMEMELTSACFGGSGKDDEDGWSSMTLWLAMAESDVYALCPFLPSRFWVPQTLLPTLSTSVVAKSRILQQDGQASEAERRVAEQQSHWLGDIDNQDAGLISTPTSTMEIYSRPERPGAIPKLQGPFQLMPDPEFGQITDIHVIASRANDEDLFDDDEWEEFNTDEGLSVGIICLATNTAQVHVCLNTEGVEAEWLPSKRSRALQLEDTPAEQELLLLETVDLARAGHRKNGSWWPTFTASPADRYEIFSTQPTGIYNISLRSWIGPLEDELSAPQTNLEGVGFRTGILVESGHSAVDVVTSEFAEPQHGTNAAITILDPASDIGYLVLASTPNALFAAALDVPSANAHPFLPDDAAPETLPAMEPRAPYQPAPAFFQQSKLPTQRQLWLQESRTSTDGDLKGERKDSLYELHKMTETHRIISTETHDLGVAVADLFRRCERMINEMRGQVEKVQELSSRIDSVTGEDPFPERVGGAPEPVRGGQRIDDRIRASKEKTAELTERVENLRRKTRGLGGKELSAKERAFAAEVAQMEASISETPASQGQEWRHVDESDLTMSTNSTQSQPNAGGKQETIAARYEAVQQLFEQLKGQAGEVRKALQARPGADETPFSASTSQQPSGFRRQKLEQVMVLLDRETALVDAVSERLERLQMGAK